MKRRMEQLINGRFEYEVPKLILSDEKIEISTKVGENQRGELHIGTEEDVKIKGIVTVTNARIVVGVDRFSGTSVQIPYGVDVIGLEAGESCSGNICLSTNIGEYQIPVYVNVEEPIVQAASGRIKNLADFTQLAKTDIREVFRLYTSPAFLQLLKNDAPDQITLYKGMSENPVTYQHLEEFLVGAGQKEPVHISVDSGELSYFCLEDSTKEQLEIRKDNWGYLSIEVEVIGDFIEIPRKKITMEDFVGSVYRLEYIIRRDRLYKGRRFGQILLKTVYGTTSVDIIASKTSSVRVDMETLTKHSKISLMRTYIDFRLERMDAKSWGSKARTILESIRQMDGYPIEYRLYEAYMNYLTGEVEETRLFLRSMKNHSFSREPLEIRAFFLYLCHLTGLKMPGQADIVEKIREWRQRKQESLQILWIMLQVDEDVNRTPVKKIYLMENIYSMGCRSPLLYLEAYMLIREDIGLLKRINDFWRSVLQFIAKENIMTEEIALRATYLSVNERYFTRGLYRVLCKAYDSYPSRDILEAICKLIMIGNPRRKEFFRWYDLAVEQEIKITRLYEYYIETMPEAYHKMLPQVIRMYFAYNNTLSDKKKAFVYANVIRNKEADRNTYQSYRQAMEIFAEEKLLQCKINEDYAVIYQEFIHEIKSKEMAEAMSQVLFSYRLYCDDKKVRNVIVCHGALEQEISYPCVDGVAYISLYTPEARILFQDEKCRRYVATVEYNLQKLLNEEKYLPQCSSFDVDNTGVLLHVCGEDCTSTPLDIQNISLFQHASANENFTKDYRHQICKKLLEYYTVHAGDDTLDSYLKSINYHSFAEVDRVLLIEVLITSGMYQEAFDLVCEYGFEHIAVPKLVRLCSRMIERTGGIAEEELLLLAAHVYRYGKYDDRILNYLLTYFEGTLDEMCSIRTSGREFYLDTYAMDERILKYSMFVRKHVENGGEILRSYMNQGGRDLVILSYLTFTAGGYFWDEIPADPYVFANLSMAYERELEMDSVCWLALLKYYSMKPSLKEREERKAEEMLEGFQQRGLRFAFYQKLPKSFLQPYQLEDRIFVEQKAASEDRVTLYYRIGSDNSTKEPYKTEPMKRMYRGLFSKEFVLFYGETLTYYITVEHQGKVRKMPEKSITMPNVDMDGRSKYQLINQMLAARKLNKKQVLAEKAHDYRQAEKISEELFKLVE